MRQKFLTAIFTTVFLLTAAVAQAISFSVTEIPMPEGKGCEVKHFFNGGVACGGCESDATTEYGYFYLKNGLVEYHVIGNTAEDLASYPNFFLDCNLHGDVLVGSRDLGPAHFKILHPDRADEVLVDLTKFEPINDKLPANEFYAVHGPTVLMPSGEAVTILNVSSDNISFHEVLYSLNGASFPEITIPNMLCAVADSRFDGRILLNCQKNRLSPLIGVRVEGGIVKQFKAPAHGLLLSGENSSGFLTAENYKQDRKYTPVFYKNGKKFLPKGFPSIPVGLSWNVTVSAPNDAGEMIGGATFFRNGKVVSVQGKAKLLPRDWFYRNGRIYDVEKPVVAKKGTFLENARLNDNEQILVEVRSVKAKATVLSLRLIGIDFARPPIASTR